MGKSHNLGLFIMAFSLSGSTITQSGTDADLSGLASLSGVTVQTNGFHKTYVTAHKIVQNGTVTIDPRYETFFSSNNTNGAWEVTNGAVLQLGKKVTLNGFEDTTRGVAMDFYGVGNYTSGGV